MAHLIFAYSHTHTVTWPRRFCTTPFWLCRAAKSRDRKKVPACTEGQYVRRTLAPIGYNPFRVTQSLIVEFWEPFGRQVLVNLPLLLANCLAAEAAGCGKEDQSAAELQAGGEAARCNNGSGCAVRLGEVCQFRRSSAAPWFPH